METTKKKVIKSFACDKELYIRAIAKSNDIKEKTGKRVSLSSVLTKALEEFVK